MTDTCGAKVMDSIITRLYKAMLGGLEECVHARLAAVAGRVGAAPKRESLVVSQPKGKVSDSESLEKAKFCLLTQKGNI